jgi:hypothetical protein
MANLQGKYHFIDLGTEGKILKIREFKEIWQVYGLDLSGSIYDPVPVYCGR